MAHAWGHYWRNTFHWQGRTNRREFWWSAATILLLAAGICAGFWWWMQQPFPAEAEALDNGPFLAFFGRVIVSMLALGGFVLITLWPSLTLLRRRYRDAAVSGWWLLGQFFVCAGGLLLLNRALPLAVCLMAAAAASALWFTVKPSA